MPTTHTAKNQQPAPPTATKATAKQLRYLKALAAQAGQSFTYPQTIAAASGEIRRLKAILATTDQPLERGAARRERHDISRARAEQAGGATAIRPDETTGFGSSARWA